MGQGEYCCKLLRGDAPDWGVGPIIWENRYPYEVGGCSWTVE